MAQAYLEFLYAEAGQEIAAKHYYRPRLAAVVAKYAAQFPRVSMFSITEVASGWQEVQKIHCSEGGVFDQLYRAKRWRWQDRGPDDGSDAPGGLCFRPGQSCPGQTSPVP
jgi:hypothetical protein